MTVLEAENLRDAHLAELPVVLSGQEHCSGHLHSQSLDWPFCVAQGVASEIYEIRSEARGGGAELCFLLFKSLEFISHVTLNIAESSF